jgi:hypothetical protein
MNRSAQDHSYRPRRRLLVAMAVLGAVGALMLSPAASFAGSHSKTTAQQTTTTGTTTRHHSSGTAQAVSRAVASAQKALNSSSSSSSGRGSSGITGLGVLLAVILALVGWFVGRTWGRRPADQPAAAPRSRPDSGRASSDGRGDRDREILVGACVELADVVPSESLRRQLREALSAVGVEAVEPALGSPFDAASYRIVDRVSTHDPAMRNRIAGTERPGYVDRGRPIRDAEVLVYSVEGPTHA